MLKGLPAEQKGISKTLNKHHVKVMPERRSKTANLSHFNLLPHLPPFHTEPQAVLHKINIFAMFMHIEWQHLSVTFVTLASSFLLFWSLKSNVEESRELLRNLTDADFLEFPSLLRTDYLQTFPSRTPPRSAITNIVRHTIQNTK